MNYETVESDNDNAQGEEKMTNDEKMIGTRMNETVYFGGDPLRYRKSDKYDAAIDYLTEHPEMIAEAWGNPEDYEGRGGELFGFVGPDWKNNDNKVRYEGQHGTCGCLQQIRACKVNDEYDSMEEALRADGAMVGSFWPRLWAKIANDRNLPHCESDITVEDLPIFADWQREIDELRKADGF